MVMVQATSLTPCSRALAISSSRDMAFCCFMTFFISGAPMPAKFILDRPSLLGAARHHHAEHALQEALAAVALTFCGLRRRLRPQKVKKMVTSSPMAAAPLAIMRAAMALSKSPLNRMMVFLRGVHCFLRDSAQATNACSR